MARTKIILNRQSDLILDNALITKPQGIVLTDISGVSEAVASINEAASIEMTAEASQRVAGDLSIQNQIDNVLTNVDPAALDSLTEIVTAFQSADGDLNGAITALAGAATTDLSAEIAARVSGDVSLDATVNELHAQQGARITNELSTELSARISGDVSLDATVNELHAQQGARITNELSTELSNRVAGDVSLDMFINELHAQQGARITNELSTELSDRVAGDTSLQNQIDFITNNTDAAAIDSLTEIVAAFQSADGDINNAITTLAGAAGSDLSTEIARAGSAEASLAANLSSEISVRTADVDAEESRATSAELSLSADLSAEASERQQGINELYDTFSGDLSSEVSNRTADVDAEESRAISAEASLSADLSTEINERETQISYLGINKLDLAGGTMAGTINMGGNLLTGIGEIFVIEGALVDMNGSTITNVANPTNDGDATNKLYVDSALSTEVSRAEFAEASIATQLSSEVSYIIANTDLTSIDSFAEVVADMSSEISRAESAEASIALDFTNVYAKHVAVNETPDGSLALFTLATPVREGSELIYLNGLTLSAAEMTHYDGWQAVYNFADLIINPLFPEVNNFGWSIIQRGSNISVLMQASYDPANSYGWTEQEFLDKKSNVESLMSTYEMTYRPSNQIDVMGGSYGFIESANGADFVTTEGDYTTTIVNSKVESVTFTEAPGAGYKVRAYGVC